MKATGAALNNKHPVLASDASQGHESIWNHGIRSCPEAVNMTHDQQNEVWHDFKDC